MSAPLALNAPFPGPRHAQWHGAEVHVAQARPYSLPSPALGTQVHVAQASPYFPKFQSPQPLVQGAQARLGFYNGLDTTHLSNLTYPGSTGVAG